jgi:uncharacterized Zn-binding protein involved in type VI secretion
MPLEIMKGSPTVMINGLPAARVTDMTIICSLPGCVPGGPGMIAMGSATVMISKLPAARAGDMTTHAACAAATIPMPTGIILPPCSPTVMIGG